MYTEIILQTLDGSRYLLVSIVPLLHCSTVGKARDEIRDKRVRSTNGVNFRILYTTNERRCKRTFKPTYKFKYICCLLLNVESLLPFPLLFSVRWLLLATPTAAWYSCWCCPLRFHRGIGDNSIGRLKRRCSINFNRLFPPASIGKKAFIIFQLCCGRIPQLRLLINEQDKLKAIPLVMRLRMIDQFVLSR